MKRLSVFFIVFIFCFSSIYGSAVYKSSVTASFYAEDFHGKKTSNGEIFNMWAMTCAHKMLPFNTILKVTNLSNGKSVQVRVNDRGPFVGTREIDLSKGAASKLGMIGSGTAKVRLEIIQLGKYTKASVVTGKKACARAGIKYVQVKMPENSNVDYVENFNLPDDKIAKLKSTKREQGLLWDIQVGSFSKKENARQFAIKIKNDGFTNVILQNAKDFTRVSLKAVESDNVNYTIDLLASKGYKDLVVRQRKVK